jgi:DnaK suppressor protein
MDTETKARFRVQLEMEKQRIIESSKNTLNEIADKTQERVGDEGDEAQSLAQMHLTMRFRERDRHMLEKIEAALDRLKDGSYGECDDCGEAIGAKRLELRPTTTLCISCKEAEEKKEKEFA